MALTRNATRTGARTFVFVLLAGAIVALTVLVYTPGMTGGFAFDDYPNIVRNRAVTAGDLSPAGLAAVIESGVAGPLKRPLSMLSFAINYRFAGLAPAAYKITNLAIHLLNGLLLIALVRRLLRAPVFDPQPWDRPAVDTAALLTAGLWLVHPLNLTSVLFVVQRMNSLAACFSLLATIAYCAGRRRMVDGRPGGRVFVFGLFPLAGLLGVLCKENALLVIPLAGVAEACFFRLAAARAVDRRLVAGAFALTLGVPVAAAAALIVSQPEWLTTQFPGRGFSPLERGYSELRVIGFYVAMLIAPRLGAMGLYHDDFIASGSLFAPPSTLFAAIFIGAVLIAALLSMRRYPLAAFPVLWFAVGHALESTVLPLELVHEHRNYLPGIAIWFGLACALVSFARYTRRAWLPGVAGGGLILAFALLTFVRAGDWSDPVTLALIEAERNPDSFRTVYELGRVQYGLYLLHGDRRDFAAALASLERAATLDRDAKRPLLEIVKLSYRHELEPRPRVREELLGRYRNGLFRHNDWVDLQDLVKCQASSDCVVPGGLIIELYAAALSNPTVSGHARAQLMSDLAVFYANTLKEFEPAIALLDDAVALRPEERRFRLLLAETLVLARRDERAADVLATLASMPGRPLSGNDETRRIGKLKRILAKGAGR